MEEKLGAALKKIDVLEEKKTEDAGTIHRLINEKLALISGTPRETTEVNEKEEAEERQAPVPKGPTL
jgi:hypothetical protein